MVTPLQYLLLYMIDFSFLLALSAAIEGGLTTATNSACDLLGSWQRPYYFLPR